MTNSWIGTLVVLLVVAAQVIPAILQAIAKKRAEERARQLTTARQAQQLPEEFTSPPSAQSPGRTADPFARRTGTSTADDIATRRKAQLEQLRNRRDARRSDATVQVRTGSIGAPTPAPGIPKGRGGPQGEQSRMNKSAATALRTTEMQRRPAPVAPAQRQDPAQESAISRQRQAQAATTRQAAVEGERQRKKSDDSKQALRDAGPLRLDDADVLAATQRRARSVGLARRLRQPAAMRQAFVLKELLDLPVSMRENQIAG